MKVTVKDRYLNVRLNKPSINAQCNQYIAPGSEIEVDGQLYKGDLYEGIDTWMKDDAGNYYWSGGVTSNMSAVNPVNAAVNLGWGIRLLGVDTIWTKTKGEKIKIAILDTGIDLKNDDLNKAVVAGYNIVTGTSNIQDNGYHGTYCSSIVGSRGLNGITGVAPACELIIIKVAENEIMPSGPAQLNAQEANRLKGIKKAIEAGADIISMSFGNTQEDTLITAELKNIMQSGVICIAAAGNNSNDVVNFPANLKGMISVGNIGCRNPNVPVGQGDFFLSDRSPGIASDSQHEGITVVAPGDGVSTYDTSGNIVPSISGTSFATPYVAGLAALWLSIIKQRGINVANNHNEFRTFLINNARTDSPGYSQGTWGAGVINPLAILSVS